METISSIMKEKREFNPQSSVIANAKINQEAFNLQYIESIKDPPRFWESKASEISWFKNWDKVFEWDKERVKFQWFKGGKLNACFNCLDRNLITTPDKFAIIWQGEKEEDVRKYTFKELHRKVCRFANVLKKKGISKGDRVCLYLPMIPELAIAVLACARIGAIHSVVFGGFSAISLRDRLLDSECKILITADGVYRAGKLVKLKDIADKADCDCVETVIVVNHVESDITWNKKDVWWMDEISKVSDDCEAEVMDAEDPLFILYTSGTTGKPKGVLHTTGGYLLYVNQTFKYIFDYKENEIYWCTADIGWITGHSYILYGPLSNGATTLMFEGVPTYPDPGRFWKIVNKFKVNIFYTAPTAIRALLRYGESYVSKYDLSSLRILGTVGEPINPEAWMWYYNIIGRQNCPIVDTWWQTETGGIMITPLPVFKIKPGSASKPFFGVKPRILKENGTEAAMNEGGYLVIQSPTPGMMRTIYGDHQRYVDTYWKRFPGMYFTGDSARIDEDGDFWLMGRVDDVINVSGHRLGTAEVESALVSHEKVSEAAVVPITHEIKGEALYAFVTLNKNESGGNEMAAELKAHVAKVIGPIAKPDKIQFADALPKTRSGKIMRRILKAIANGNDIGDTTTLSDPNVLDELLKLREI